MIVNYSKFLNSPKPRMPKVPQIKEDPRPLVEFFTDGSWDGDNRDGGWGCIIRDANGERELGGYRRFTTGSEMELLAVYEGIHHLDTPSRIHLVTDSQSLISWVYGWDIVKALPSRNFAVRPANPVRGHVDQLFRAMVYYKHIFVEPLWVPAHTGHPENERADEIARLCRHNQIADYAKWAKEVKGK